MQASSERASGRNALRYPDFCSIRYLFSSPECRLAGHLYDNLRDCLEGDSFDYLQGNSRSCVAASSRDWGERRRIGCPGDYPSIRSCRPYLWILISGFWFLDSELWTIRTRKRYGRSADLSSNLHVGDVKPSPFTAPIPFA